MMNRATRFQVHQESEYMTTMGLWWRAISSVAVPLLVRMRSAHRMMASVCPTRISTGVFPARR